MPAPVLADPPATRGSGVRRLLVLALTALIGVVLGLASAAPAQAAPAQAVAAASGYTITGVVTGRDASGATVPLPDAYLYAQPVDWNDDRDIFGEADANGRFSIDVGTPGEYTLYANCLPSTPCADTHASQYYDMAPGLGEAKKIVVSATAPTVTANIRLPRYATVRGKVTSDAGAAVAGITVESVPSSGGTPATATTDATGAYTLTKVQPGKVVITAREDWEKHNWNAEYWNGTATSTPDYPYPGPVLPEGPTVTTANFQLSPTLGFYGEAVDSAGAPIQGVRWTVFTHNAATGAWDTPQYGPLMTDGAGKFFWDTEVGGRYKVCFYDDHYGPEAPNRTTRYASRCWDNATTSDTATILTQPTTPQQRTLRVVLPVAGKSLTASEPWVSGLAKVGSPLTVHPGAWGPSGVALTYQWGWWDSANGWTYVPITGATGTTYTPTSDVAGKTIAASVTGTLSGHVTTSMHSIGYTVGSGVALTSPLQLSGQPVVGQVLTANHGTPVGGAAIDYSGYEWRVEGGQSQWGSKTLTLTSDMIGKKVSVRYYIRTTSPNSDTSYVATVGPVAATFGTLTAPTPTIAGTAKVGSVLTAAPGTWGPAPVTLAYQWKRAGVAIPGATASTYTLTGSDYAKAITVTVTGSKSTYTTVAKTSAATAAVAAGTLTAPTPTISGSKTVGVTLTAVPGTWGPAPVTLAYQWFRSGVAITGATASTYKLTTTDMGATVTLRVTGTKSGYTSVAKTSLATATVLGVLTTATPTISGTVKAGSTLTATPGTWGPAPVTLTYQWNRAGVAITGATSSTYTLTGTDTGKTITVTVTGRKSGYAAAAKVSAATVAVAAGTLTVPTPTISGTKAVGSTLTAVPGTWGPAPVTLAYQWYRAGVAVTGATSSTFALATTDKGKTLTVRVTGSKTGYTSVARTSAATTAIL